MLCGENGERKRSIYKGGVSYSTIWEMDNNVRKGTQGCFVALSVACLSVCLQDFMVVPCIHICQTVKKQKQKRTKEKWLYST